MNHTCKFGDITATAHDCAGDLFLAQMSAGQSIYEFPGINKLPPDLSVHFDPWVFMRDADLKDRWRQAVNEMIRHGYEYIQYRNPGDFEERHRFRWLRPF